MNKLAKAFYHHILMHTELGKPALDYLLDRGLTEETLIEFEIGFSPAQRNALFIYLKSQDEDEFEIEIYQKSGLFSENTAPEDSDFLDRFTNRIIFPIHNERGHAIGFSGRVFLEDTSDSFVQAKYLNTPETNLFNKSKILYNFDKAKGSIRREKEAIFFEGYMDVIAAWQAGVKNGIASMGTSLTEGQVQMIDRFSEHIVLAFDGDDAGKDAIKRSVDYLAKNTHFTIEIISFPTGLDPDDYIQKHGVEEFNDLLTHGRDTHMSFLMQYHRRNMNIANESEQIQYIELILKELTSVDSLVEREIYLTQLAEEFGITLDTLKTQFETVMDGVQNKQLAEYKDERRRASIAQSQPQVSYQNKPKYSVVEQAERMLLNRLFYHEEAWIFLNRLDSDFHFRNEDYQLIYILFESYREKDFDRTNTEGFLDYLQEDHLKHLVAEIFLMDIGELTESEISDYVELIKNVSPVKERLVQKIEELKAAQREGNLAKQTKLAVEVIELNKMLKNK